MLHGAAVPSAVRTRVHRFLNDRSPGCGLFVEVGETQPTLEALRWGAELAAMLGDRFDRESIAFVEACRRTDHGFAMYADQAGSSLAATYYATRILNLSGDLDLLPPQLADRLAGTVFSPAGTVVVDVDDLFYAVRALEQAGRPPAATRVRRIARFIDLCAGQDGGFGVLPGEPPHIEQTYCCLQMRRILGAAAPATDLRRHRDWVAGCYGMGRFAPAPERAREPATRWLATTYWGVHAARLSAAHFPAGAVSDRVLASQHGDGGFGDERGPSLWSSYCALRILQLASAR